GAVYQDASWPWHAVFELAAAERKPQLVAVDVCCFGGLLHGHIKLRHVEEKLQQVLVLRVAALNGEGKVRFAFFQRHRWGQRHPRPLARGYYVERVDDGIEYKTLHTLAHADAGMPRNTGGEPAPTRCNGYHPAFRIGGFHGGSAPQQPIVV